MAEAQRSSRAWAVVVPALAALLAAGAILVLDAENGLFPLLGLRDEVARAEARVESLRDERIDLSTRATRLRDDPLELEMVARERLGMVRPGEIVVQLDPEARR